MRFGEIEGFIGRVIESKGSLIKVDILGVKTDFIPYLQTFNSFKTSFSPPQIDQQVLVFKLSSVMIAIGDLSSNFKDTSPNKEITQYADGTKISYDISNSTLEVSTQGTINIICKKANIQSDEVVVECKNAKVKADEVNLGDSGGGGVVTTQCICAFTGTPHPEGSSKVKAIK